MLRKLSILCAAMAVLGLVSVAGASTMVIGDAVLLSDLIGNSQPLVVGDKEFTDFSYVRSGDMPSSAGVNVVPIQDMMGNFGIRFQGGFNDLPGGDPSDALITYTVSVAPGVDRLISDVHLAGNPSVANDGVGFAGVVETFLPVFPDLQLQIFSDTGLGQVDWAFLDTPVASLPVQKDILLNAGTSSGATISFIDQTFSQVPEPGTLVLLLGCLAGLTFRRR